MKARAAAILLGLALLIWVVILLDGASLLRAWRYAAEHPLGLIAAFGAYTGAFVLRTLAWRALIPERVSIARLFTLLLAALFLNHTAPAKAGDFARMYGVARQGVGGGRAVASVVLARLVDLIGLLAVLAGAWALAGGAQWGPFITPVGVVAVAAPFLWAFARSGVPVRLGRLKGPVEKFRNALRETSPSSLGAALFWAAPAWVLEAGIVLFVVRAVGLEVSPAGIVAAACTAVLLAAVPLAPGSLGTYEAGMVFALVALGVPPGPALAVAVTSHALKFLYAFAAAPLTAYEGLAASQSHRPEEVKTDETSVEV